MKGLTNTAPLAVAPDGATVYAIEQGDPECSSSTDIAAEILAGRSARSGCALAVIDVDTRTVRRVDLDRPVRSVIATADGAWLADAGSGQILFLPAAQAAGEAAVQDGPAWTADATGAATALVRL